MSSVPKNAIEGLKFLKDALSEFVHNTGKDLSGRINLLLEKAATKSDKTEKTEIFLNCSLNNYLDEAKIRTWVLDKFLDSLGWSYLTPEQRIEYEEKKYGYIDYFIKDGGLIVEAKRLSHKLPILKDDTSDLLRSLAKVFYIAFDNLSRQDGSKLSTNDIFTTDDWNIDIPNQLAKYYKGLKDKNHQIKKVIISNGAWIILLKDPDLVFGADDMDKLNANDIIKIYKPDEDLDKDLDSFRLWQKDGIWEKHYNEIYREISRLSLLEISAEMEIQDLYPKLSDGEVESALKAIFINDVRGGHYNRNHVNAVVGFLLRLTNPHNKLVFARMDASGLYLNAPNGYEHSFRDAFQRPLMYGHWQGLKYVSLSELYADATLRRDVIDFINANFFWGKLIILGDRDYIVDKTIKVTCSNFRESDHACNKITYECSCSNIRAMKEINCKHNSTRINNKGCPYCEIAGLPDNDWKYVCCKQCAYHEVCCNDSNDIAAFRSCK